MTVSRRRDRKDHGKGEENDLLHYPLREPNDSPAPMNVVRLDELRHPLLVR